MLEDAHTCFDSGDEEVVAVAEVGLAGRRDAEWVVQHEKLLLVPIFIMVLVSRPVSR